MEKKWRGGKKILNSCSDLRAISAVLLTSATNVEMLLSWSQTSSFIMYKVQVTVKPKQHIKALFPVLVSSLGEFKRLSVKRC